MINYTGIASIVLFYILILAVGMWAARKNTGGGDQEVGGRARGNRLQGCQMAKFDPFLSLDCARVEGVGAQSKERKGSNFAA